MKLCIEVPTWLGDAVMVTPAIESIVQAYPEADITILGSPVSTAIFAHHPHVSNLIIDKSKQSRFRFLWLYVKARSLGKFDKVISFRSAFPSRFFLMCVQAKEKQLYKKNHSITQHQVLRYYDFIAPMLKDEIPAQDLRLYMMLKQYDKPTVGINPGASYGSAKRWYPEKFAEVAKGLSLKYDIVIFGGSSEVDMASDIEKILQKSHIENYINLAGKTSIQSLCEKIGGLDLFITGDSGPMHIAAAFKVPTVALFGPTKDKETSQWHNPQSIIVKKEMDCAPCMKRTCPFGHHECMKFITAEDVLNAVRSLDLT